LKSHTPEVFSANRRKYANSTLSRRRNRLGRFRPRPDPRKNHRHPHSLRRLPLLDSRIYATAEEALAHPCDVFFEYTKPDIAKSNVLAALRHGAHVVIGTSGLTDEDYAEIATAAKQQQRGVLAVGNFALTVVLLQNSPNSPRGTSLSGRSSTMPATAKRTPRAVPCGNW